MATKYTRPNFRDRALGVRRDIEREETDLSRPGMLPPGARLYFVIGALILAALLFQNASVRLFGMAPVQAASAQVVEKIASDEDDLDGPPLVTLRLLPPAELREVTVPVSPPDFERLSPGDSLTIEYRLERGGGLEVIGLSFENAPSGQPRE